MTATTIQISWPVIVTSTMARMNTGNDWMRSEMRMIISDHHVRK